MYAQKKGTYTVTVDVVGNDSSVKSSHSVKVYATKENGIKNATFAGREIFYEVAPQTAGAFKVNMDKGYKLKSITMTYYDETGKEVTKTIKNNSKVTLSEYARKYEDEWTSSYDDDWGYNLSTEMFARTEFTISYQNTKTKATGEIWYYLYRNPKN